MAVCVFLYEFRHCRTQSRDLLRIYLHVVYFESNTQSKERGTKAQIDFLFNDNQFTLPHIKMVTQEFKYDSMGHQL